MGYSSSGGPDGPVLREGLMEVTVSFKLRVPRYDEAMMRREIRESLDRVANYFNGIVEVGSVQIETES